MNHIGQPVLVDWSLGAFLSSCQWVLLVELDGLVVLLLMLLFDLVLPVELDELVE